MILQITALIAITMILFAVFYITGIMHSTVEFDHTAKILAKDSTEDLLKILNNLKNVAHETTPNVDFILMVANEVEYRGNFESRSLLELHNLLKDFKYASSKSQLDGDFVLALSNEYEFRVIRNPDHICIVSEDLFSPEFNDAFVEIYNG